MDDSEARWNDALCRLFYDPVQAGRPTYLSADKDTLAEAARRAGMSEPENALSSLLTAVRPRVHPVTLVGGGVGRGGEESVLEAVAGAGDVDDVGVVEEAVGGAILTSPAGQRLAGELGAEVDGGFLVRP